MRVSRAGSVICALLLAAACAMASAQEMPAASPESVGMSRERLARVYAVVLRFVQSGSFANAVRILARRGRVVIPVEEQQVDHHGGLPGDCLSLL